MAKNQVFKLKMPLPSKQWVVGSIPARGAIYLFVVNNLQIKTPYPKVLRTAGMQKG